MAKHELLLLNTKYMQSHFIISDVSQSPVQKREHVPEIDPLKRVFMRKLYDHVILPCMYLGLLYVVMYKISK